MKSVYLKNIYINAETISEWQRYKQKNTQMFAEFKVSRARNFFDKSKRIFSLIEDDVKFIRMLLFVAGFAYFIFGLTMYQSNLTSKFLFYENMLIGVSSLVLVSLSFIVKYIKKNLLSIIYGVVFLVLIQSIDECATNKFEINNTVALLLTFMVCSTVFRKPNILYVFLAFNFTLILVITHMQETELNSDVVATVFGSAALILGITFGSKLRTQEKLKKSEDLFKNIFNESADANLMTKLDEMKIINCNKRAIELFEVSSMEELVGLDPIALQKNPFADSELDRIKKQIKDNWGWSKEMEYNTRKGKTFWGNLEFRVVEYLSKPHLQIRITDISERKRMEKLLLAEKQVLEMASKDNDLTRALNHLITNIEELSSGMRCAILKTSEETNSLNWYVSPNISPDFIKSIGDVNISFGSISSGKAAMSKCNSFCNNIETNEEWKEYLVFARRYKIASCFSYPILSENGNVLGVFEAYYESAKEKPEAKDAEIITRIVNIIGVLMEKDKAVTDNKLSLERIKTQNEELIKTNSELDRFVYSTSHDLRAPLMNVIGLVDIVELTITDEKPKKYLEMMRTSVTNLDNTIKEILEYSKNTRTEIEIEEVDVHVLTEEVLAGIQFMDGSDKVEKRLNFDMQVPLYTDKRRMLVILNNLISNAVKYQNKTEQNQFVSVDAIVTASKVEITIADNGIGITPQYQEKIFDMFYRATTQGSGSGLGLYILKETLNKIKGKISVISTPNVGTTFKVEIPNVKLN